MWILCPVCWWRLTISLKQQFWIPSFRKQSLRITGTGSPKEEQNHPPIMLIGCDLILRHKGDASFSQGSSVDFCWFFCSPWSVAPGRWNGMTHRCNCSLQNVICLCGQTALFVALLVIFFSFSDREAGSSQRYKPLGINIRSGFWIPIIFLSARSLLHLSLA